MFESDMDYSNDRYAPREDLPEEGSVGVPGKKTQETLTAADSILEAIDIAEEELKRIEQHKVCLIFSFPFLMHLCCYPLIHLFFTAV